MKEVDLLEGKEAREDCISRIEVLDKVGELLLLPNTEYATINQVSNYYNVEQEAIRKLFQRNKEELVHNGAITLGANKIVDDILRVDKMFIHKTKSGILIGDNKLNYKSNLLFSKRAILNVGMLLTESYVAKEVRKLLLKENPKLFSELSSENNLRFKKYETEIKNFLNFTFGEENVKCQVKCGKYKLDFVLFDIVHIEVDEFGHSSYDKEKEKERQEYILKYTDYYTFRYNPQKDKPYKLIYEIMDLFTHIGFPNGVEEDDCYYKNYYFES